MKVSALFYIVSFLLLATKAEALEWKDFADEAAVPFTESKDITLYGTIATLSVLALKHQIADPIQDDTVRHKPLGKTSAVGDWIGLGFPNVFYTIGQGIAGASGDPKGFDRAIGMFKASAYSMSVTSALKVIVREPRPDNHNDRDSFPSAHSTMAFSFAGYVFAEHDLQWGLPALGFAAFTAYSRINDHRHNIHDVIAGATIGLAYGMGMSRLQKKEKPSYTFVPIFDHSTRGLAVTTEF